MMFEYRSLHTYHKTLLAVILAVLCFFCVLTGVRSAGASQEASETDQAAWFSQQWEALQKGSTTHETDQTIWLADMYVSLPAGWSVDEAYVEQTDDYGILTYENDPDVLYIYWERTGHAGSEAFNVCETMLLDTMANTDAIVFSSAEVGVVEGAWYSALEFRENTSASASGVATLMTIFTDDTLYMLCLVVADSSSATLTAADLLATIGFSDPETSPAEPVEAQTPSEPAEESLQPSNTGILSETLSIGELSMLVPATYDFQTNPDSNWHQYASLELGGALGTYEWNNYSDDGLVYILFDTTMNVLDSWDVSYFQVVLDIDPYSDFYTLSSSETREIDGVACQVDTYARGSLEGVVGVITIQTDTSIFMIGYQYTPDFTFEELLETISLQ